MAIEQTLERVRAEMAKVKVPTSYSKIYKDECMFSFATPESEGGIFVNLNSWHGVGARFLALEHERSGDVLYYNVKHYRVPIEDDEMITTNNAPKKMKLGGEDGFQVDKKNYTIEKQVSLVLMPDRAVVPLPCPELPELVLNAIAAIEVSSPRPCSQSTQSTRTLRYACAAHQHAQWCRHYRGSLCTSHWLSSARALV